MNTESKGLIHLYHGDGKGKTTAAAGLALRALGHGLRVTMLQFLKDGTSGEMQLLQRLAVEMKLPVTVLSDRVEGFTFSLSDEQKAALAVRQTQLLQTVFDRCRRGECDLLVLDELLHAIKLGLVPESPVLDFLRTKPVSLEVVITGRNPSDELLEIADYVTELRKIKHPFDRGIAGRRGIER